MLQNRWQEKTPVSPILGTPTARTPLWRGHTLLPALLCLAPHRSPSGGAIQDRRNPKREQSGSRAGPEPFRARGRAGAGYRSLSISINTSVVGYEQKKKKKKEILTKSIKIKRSSKLQSKERQGRVSSCSLLLTLHHPCKARGSGCPRIFGRETTTSLRFSPFSDL